VLVPVERRLLACVAPGDHPDLVDAVEDARRDMQPNSEDPLADADARSARSEIELWMSNVDHDFFAIDDLSVVPPAHPAKRVIDSPQIDAALWREHEIATQSYATLGRPLDPTRAVARELASLLAVVRAARTNVPGTDVVYRVAHTACASGPFAAHALEVPWLPGCGKVDAYAPQPWENDGIVNTASATRSPDGGPCFLVPGDHGDIIGHFDEYGRRSDTRPDSQRERDAYDLLGSDPPGTFRHAFAAVWDSAFDFAVPR
jgi:hypothetical protein